MEHDEKNLEFTRSQRWRWDIFDRWGMDIVFLEGICWEDHGICVLFDYWLLGLLGIFILYCLYMGLQGIIFICDYCMYMI